MADVKEAREARDGVEQAAEPSGELAEESEARYTPRRPKSIWVVERQLQNIIQHYRAQGVELVKQRLRPGGRQGSTKREDYVDYISWQTARDLVSEVTRGLWETPPMSSGMVTWGSHGRVTVAVPVTIIAAEGRITRTGLGGDRDAYPMTAPDGETRSIEWKWDHYDNKWVKRGEGFDPVLDAWAQGFKRALAEFGLARELYPD